jgi:hypothetical protein
LPFTLYVSDDIRDLSVSANRLVPYSVLLVDPMIAAPYILGATTVGFNQVALTYSREITVPNTIGSRNQFRVDGAIPTAISYSGNVITLTLPGFPFSPGTAYPSRDITYDQAALPSNRVRAAFPVVLFEDAVSPDEFRGISSGF